MKKIIVLLVLLCFVVGCASTQALRMDIQQGYAEAEAMTDPTLKAQKLEQLKEKERQLQTIQAENRRTAAIIAGAALLGVTAGATNAALTPRPVYNTTTVITPGRTIIVR